MREREVEREHARGREREREREGERERGSVPAPSVSPPYGLVGDKGTSIDKVITQAAGRIHTVEYEPFIRSQLASRNSLQGLMWCKFGHVPCGFPRGRTPRSPQSGKGWILGSKQAKEALDLRTAALQKCAVPRRARI